MSAITTYNTVIFCQSQMSYSQPANSSLINALPVLAGVDLKLQIARTEHI